MRRGLAFSLLVACAAAGVLSAALLAATPSGIAEETTTGTTTTAPPPPPTTTTAPTTTTPTTTTPTVPRPTTIAAGVTVGGEVLVGGLSPAEATAEVKAFFARALTLRLGKVTVRVTPKQLGAAAYVGEAVRRARVAAPGANVPLKVTAPRQRIERYVRALGQRVDREPVDSKLLLRNSKPFVTEEKPGQRLRQVLLVRDLFRSLKTHARDALVLKPEVVAPETTRKSIGDVIVIRRGLNKLFLYDGMKLRRTFGVATGQSRYPTPLGRFEVVVKWKNPWWYPPASDWAKDAEPIPPGPGNPLGTRWMGISAPAVGIHGTPDPASIGYSVSHGCIRMRIPEVEWLFNQVDVGTPVYILR
ncbi:MAG TPA: L,D-transpeptidase family protein [Gaiellaceae bacterium]|nr:L,D-transpeptidase family protein [Gaiellaceae bacterium]